MKIKKQLQKELETFLQRGYGREYGGFLIANRLGIIDTFLPVPNMHKEPRNHFLPSDNARDLAEAFSRRKTQNYSSNVKAFFHSHPDPCIMSAADLCAAGGFYKDLYFVTISPLQPTYARKYIWYACKGIVPERIDFV